MEATSFFMFLFYVPNLIKIKEMSDHLIGAYGKVMAALSRQIHGNAEDAVAKLSKQPEILFLNIVPELLLFLHILRRVGAHGQHGGNRGDDFQVIVHVVPHLAVSGHALLDALIYVVIHHQLIHPQLLINPGDHDLLVYGLIGTTDVVVIEIHIQIEHILYKRKGLEHVEIIYIKAMLRQL